MNSRKIKLEAAYHLSRLLDSLQSFDSKDLTELVKLVGPIQSQDRERLRYLVIGKSGARRGDQEELSFHEQFKFDRIMSKLRNAIMHSNQIAGIGEADWLIKLMLSSPKVFPTVRELETFLVNMTGVEHGTKSTGRDRIVDWYIKNISKLPDEEKDRIYQRMARHLFISFSSNYEKWKELLSS